MFKRSPGYKFGCYVIKSSSFKGFDHVTNKVNIPVKMFNLLIFCNYTSHFGTIYIALFIASDNFPSYETNLINVAVNPIQFLYINDAIKWRSNRFSV